MLYKSLMTWPTLVFYFLLWTFEKIKNFTRSVILGFKLPGPPALPILGNAFIVRNDKDMVEIGNNAYQTYGSMFRVWLFIVPFVFVYEPEHLKVILSSVKLSKKNIFYRVMHTFIGDGLITSNDEKWRKNRRLIQPYFQVNLLENYFNIFAQTSEDMLKSLSGERYVKITHIINICVVNVLHKTILGVDLKTEDETPFRRGELLVIKRLLKPWLLFDNVFKYSEMSKNESKQTNALHRYVKKVLDERIRKRKAKEISDTCLLDALIELSETADFSEEDILNETVTFMLAGQDSVGAAVAFCLYYLAKHQDIQQKVYKEINEIIYEDQLKTIRIEQLNQMHYVEQCIKETMRLAPSVPIISRVLTNDVVLGDVTIPTGSNIFISPFITHRLPHVFPDPIKFDPDRFSHENLKKMHPFSFIPFSAGPRNCIGFKFAYLEMKTIVATVIKNYHISLKPGCEDISLAYRVTLRTKKGVWLEVHPRNKKDVNSEALLLPT